MQTTKRVALAALAAMLLLSLAAGTASALRSLSSSERIITLLARELTLSATNLPASVICEVGMTITLNSTAIPKSGFANPIAQAELRVLRCREGNAVVLPGRYGVNYLGFTGTLPNITGLMLQLLRVAFLIEAGGGLARCLIIATALELQTVVSGRLERLGSTTRAFALREVTVRSLAGSLICPTAEETRLTLL